MKISDEDVDLKTNVNKVLSQCIPCKFCKKKCMYIEEEENWDSKDTVIRIGSGCDNAFQLWDKDDGRTIGFQLEKCAINDWNELNRT